MIPVRWTPQAADDLAQIVDRIRKDNPDAARRVAKVIFDAVSGLRKLPNRGRSGLAPHTRELVFAPWPYIAVYEVGDHEVLVLRVRHAAKNWP